jgi:hypothetical protein
MVGGCSMSGIETSRRVRARKRDGSEVYISDNVRIKRGAQKGRRGGKDLMEGGEIWESACEVCVVGWWWNRRGGVCC